jgi:voltage-gated potassium channel
VASLYTLIEDPTTSEGCAFTFAIQALIVLSLLAFSIETLPGLSSQLIGFLDAFEVMTVIVFTLEYFLRVYVSRPRIRFIFSFYGIIDLFAVLPFLLSAGLDLRSIRILRFFRLFRILKLVRYSEALNRFQHALRMAREELVLFFCMTGALLYISAVGIYYFENTVQPQVFASIFHSLWWAVTTLTTVGYGDAYPVTLGGRLFTFFVLMLGLGIIAIPTGIFAAALSQARRQESDTELEETPRGK